MPTPLRHCGRSESTASVDPPGPRCLGRRRAGPANPDRRQLEARLPRGATVWVPEHYFVEVAAVLRRSELNDRFPSPRIQVALGRLLTAPLNRVSVAPLLPEAWALRHNLTVADALYVVVASHLEAALVTTDQRLAAAPALQVETITP